jgi:hypothetical protein
MSDTLEPLLSSKKNLIYIGKRTYCGTWVGLTVKLYRAPPNQTWKFKGKTIPLTHSYVMQLYRRAAHAHNKAAFETQTCWLLVIPGDHPSGVRFEVLSDKTWYPSSLAIQKFVDDAVLSLISEDVTEAILT